MDVDVGADHRSGGTPADRRDLQAVQEINVHSRPACEVNWTDMAIAPIGNALRLRKVKL
jgi:hypothetical protein